MLPTQSQTNPVVLPTQTKPSRKRTLLCFPPRVHPVLHNKLTPPSDSSEEAAPEEPPEEKSEKCLEQQFSGNPVIARIQKVRNKFLDPFASDSPLNPAKGAAVLIVRRGVEGIDKFAGKLKEVESLKDVGKAVGSELDDKLKFLDDLIPDYVKEKAKEAKDKAVEKAEALAADGKFAALSAKKGGQAGVLKTKQALENFAKDLFKTKDRLEARYRAFVKNPVDETADALIDTKEELVNFFSSSNLKKLPGMVRSSIQKAVGTVAIGEQCQAAWYEARFRKQYRDCLESSVWNDSWLT